jgi:hypothetical protein
MYTFIHYQIFINLHFIFKLIFTVYLIVFVLYGHVVSSLDKVVSYDERVHAFGVILNVVVLAYF